MKRMKYLFMTPALVGILAFSIQSNIFAQADEDRETRESPMSSPSALIPGNHFKNSTNSVTIPAGAGWVASGTKVTIANGTIARNVIIQFSTETKVTSSSMDIRYSIDGGAPIVIGPEYFTANTTYETRTHIGVKNLPAGNHTVQPYFKFNGASGSGSIYYRSLTVEGRTS